MSIKISNYDKPTFFRLNRFFFPLAFLKIDVCNNEQRLIPLTDPFKITAANQDVGSAAPSVSDNMQEGLINKYIYISSQLIFNMRMKTDVTPHGGDVSSSPV